MNKTKIEWCDYTWNPITGCLGGCYYCYARKIAKRFGRSFSPAFHPEKLDEPGKVKKPSRIFVGSVTDLWGKGVKPAWREEVFEKMYTCYWHTFILLTKQPQNILPGEIRQPNIWLGVTITRNQGWWRWNAIKNIERPRVKFISFEPLLGSINIGKQTPDWMIIGGLTGEKQKTKKEWAMKLVKNAPIVTAVFMKDNLGIKPRLRQFPE